MADREDKVYQAKLAEQAERYDGKFNITHCNNIRANCSKTNGEIR